MWQMRSPIPIPLMFLMIGAGSCDRSKREVSRAIPSLFVSSSSSSTNIKPDFDKEIRPILQSRCMPCHFQGGKVYDHLPFDRPETITRLGTKLFTRIKDEKDERIIREFLAQP